MTAKGIISGVCFLIAVICFYIGTYVVFQNRIQSVSSAQLRLVIILAIPMFLFGLILIL